MAVLVVIEDALQAVIPHLQKGFLKQRNMLHHVNHAKDLWDHAPDGAFILVDFANAYDSVFHTFFEAAL